MRSVSEAREEDRTVTPIRPVGGPDAPVSGETEPVVLSRGNLFCVVNRRGDIAPAGARDLGLFHEDTRHLSHLELSIGPTVEAGAAHATPPATVLSSATGGSSTSQIDLTLTDNGFGGFLDDPQNFLHVRRRQLLDDSLVERITVTNHLRRSVAITIGLSLEADFADIFEVRGAHRERRGEVLPVRISEGRLEYGYAGLDGARYRTVVHLMPAPTKLDAGGARWDLVFDAGETLVLEVSVQPLRADEAERPWQPFDVRAEHVDLARRQFLDGSTRLRCDNNRFAGMLERAMSDIDSLRLSVDGRSILGAGIPWYAAPFGRDAIITSLETLSVAPHLAVETLRTLAAYQGERDDEWREEEPGKIMHELRRGEMARAGEIPHSPYYGTIDATPLWLMLLGETWRWTGDDALLDELAPHAERALAWIERRLVRGEGFIRYQRTHARGLENQGWKDSRDGVSFPDGTLARTPIALVEVQGYVVAAFDAMARIRRRRGDVRGSNELRDKSRAMRRRIEEFFWVEAAGYYALALDGDGRQVTTLSSNPGHLAMCRALPAHRLRRVAEVLLSDGMYSGWGVRTVARGQAVFNPLSYHNGTVWPHDNALCAFGLALGGHTDEAIRIFDGLYAASLHFRDARLPELFCGMARGKGDFLVHYPVSCSPQAWASAAFFLLLQSVLGIQPEAPLGRVTIRNPRLPEFLQHLDVEHMRVGTATVSLHFERHDHRTHVDLMEIGGQGDLKVNIEIG